MPKQDKGNGEYLYEHPETGVYVEKEDLPDCSECDGSGEINTISPSQCTSSIDECCGGCFGEEECENCNGTGKIESDEE